MLDDTKCSLKLAFDTADHVLLGLSPVRILSLAGVGSRTSLLNRKHSEPASSDRFPVPSLE